uniref:Zinc finger CCCH domain-containing protein 18 n=2 Tax=Lygus hesperus TaxID=30085 RepID=A0A0A9XFE4_LYGHE
MDSDSSNDGEERRNGSFKKWENRANSDVSDDENFSRGAKSIDSPPESPPRGGGNLDSPPASPAQGVESPHSAYSGSSRSSQGSRGSSPARPETPQSPPMNNRSPGSPQRGGNDTPASSPIRSPPNMDSPRSSPERMCPRTPPESPGSSPDRRGRPKTPMSSPEGSRDRQRESPVSSPDHPKSPQSSPGRKSMSRSPERRSGSSRFERLERTKFTPPSSPTRRRPRSPLSRLMNAPDSPASSDDGRSNISSNSSLGSHKFGSPKKSPPPPKIEIKSHGEDLSDVSDIESIGSEIDQEKKIDDEDKKDKGSVSGLNPLEEAEQLDFEAEEEPKPIEDMKPSEDVNEAQANGSKKANASSDKETGDDEEEGEVKELEDGEITDEGENRPEETEPRPVCRFFSRGQCTWGSSCRHSHVEHVEDGHLAGTSSHEDMNLPPPQPSGPILPSPQPGLLMPPVMAHGGSGFIPNFHGMRGHPRFFRPWLRGGRGIGVRFFGPRFVHPGVTDKGNYTMFDMVRPLVAMNSGPPPPMHMFPGGPIEPMYGPRPMERPMMGPAGPPFQQPVMRRDEPPGESAWERGLRQAKEMLRRSTKRKETDVDFEEKKMNLSLAGTDEYDKENDYYTPRPSSPVFADEVYHERYPPPKETGEKRYRSVSDRFADYPPPQYYPPGGREQWFDDRAPREGRYHHHSSRHPQDFERSRSERGRGGNSVPPDDYYDSRSSRKKYSSREVTVQRSEKSDRSWKETSPSPRPRGSERTGPVRGDEWQDPWMRSKSPMRKGRPTSRSRKKSYSSRSSYSTSSKRKLSEALSGRSSSSRSSSYSSYSRSRSRSRSSGSRSPSRSRSRSSFTRRKTSPPPKRTKSPFSRDRRLDAERSLHMNPPAPSPRSLATSPPPRRNPTPPSDRSSRNLSARILAAAIRDRSSSRSSSGSDSSGSSSDSSSDSGSSSSSSRGASPPSRVPPKVGPTRKKIEIDEKMAIHAMKAKAMDALKISGQKQQIKLTLKGNTGERLPQTAPTSRKRVAESPEDEDDDAPAAKKKGAPASRREELLKQLKAVEDAIARKRSKT